VFFYFPFCVCFYKFFLFFLVSGVRFRLRF
jgi:hypothetical protein